VNSVFRASIALLAILQLWSWSAAQAKEADSAADKRYYSVSDFTRVEKIDAHVHVHGEAAAFMAQAVQDNFRILTINVDYPDFPPILEQQRAAVSLLGRYPGRVAFATTFSVQNFRSPSWGPRQRCSSSMAPSSKVPWASKSGRTSE